MGSTETVCDVLELSDDTYRVDRSYDKNAVSCEDLVLEFKIVILDDALDLAIRSLAACTAAAALSDIQSNSIDKLYLDILACCLSRSLNAHQSLSAVCVAALILAPHG